MKDLATEAIHALTHEFRALTHAIVCSKSQANAVTHEDLQKMENRLMSAIKDYADKVNAAFSDIGASVDELNTSVTGLSGDIANLKATIDKLQNSSGTINAEDQALLDQSVAQIQGISDKVKSVAASAKALDDATEAPPVA